MSFTNPYAAYQTTQTVTASQSKLIIMLHDGAIRFLAKAAAAIGNKDYNAKADKFHRASRVINQLLCSVDIENGGEISENLHRLYTYISRRMVEANAKDDIAAIKEIMTLLRDIREAWAQNEATHNGSASEDTFSAVAETRESLKAAA